MQYTVISDNFRLQGAKIPKGTVIDGSRMIAAARDAALKGGYIQEVSDTTAKTAVKGASASSANDTSTNGKTAQ